MKPLFLFFLLLVVLFGDCVVSHADEPARLDLVGHVTGTSDAALPNVRVMILAVGPRKGSSPLCPYNYPDCGKTATTDAQGDFRLPALDPAMDFCVIALVSGYEPSVQSKILPEAGPLNIKLRLRDSSKLPPGQQVAGRIIGPDGKPVAGAAIDVEGVEQRDLTRWGGNDVTDGMTVSDDNGEFHLAGRKEFTAVQALVNAPGLAVRWARLEPGKTILLRMKTGVTACGRLLKDGQPLKGLALGLCTEERECGKYFNGFQAMTNDDGRFVFRNVPAGLKFEIFGKMDSFRNQGAACRQDFVSAADGGTTDLGDWQVSPALRLTGKVILADGKPLPANTRLMINRASAWDTTLVPLDGQGSFDVTGIPAEQISLHVSVSGYRLSTKNPSINLSDHRSLVGRVAGNMADLNILLEPGAEPNWNDIDRPSYEELKKAEQMPLRGLQ